MHGNGKRPKIVVSDDGAGVVSHAALGDGETVQDAIAAQTRKHYAEKGVDLSSYTTDEITRLHQYNVFPSMSTLASADHVAMTAEQATLDVVPAERLTGG